MSSNIARLVLMLALVVLTSTAQARQGTIVTPAEVKWPANATGGVGTSGASGIQTVVLTGDPAKPGLYTIRLKAAPGMKIQAHSHRDDRSAMVVATSRGASTSPSRTSQAIISSPLAHAIV